MIAILLLFVSVASYENPSNCNSNTQFYNYLTHTCTDCPSSTASSTTGFCNCTGSFYPNPRAIGFSHADSCVDLNTNPSTNEIIVIYDQDGTENPQIVQCVDSYANEDKTACIPCGHGMEYDSTNSRCICKDANYFIVGQACFEKLSATIIDSNNYVPFSKAVVGCIDWKEHDSCQILLNYCSRTYVSTDVFCQQLYNITDYTAYDSLPTPRTTTASTQSLNIYASSITGTNTTTIKNKIQFYMIQYNWFGETVDIKPLSRQIFPSKGTEENLINFQSFGKNIQKQSETDNDDTEYFYDIYALNVDRQYVQVPLFFNSENFYYKRLKLNLGSYNSVRAHYQSAPPLRVPYLQFYENTTNHYIQSKSESETITNIESLIPFVIFNIIILFIFVYNFYRYMKYNPNETNDPYYFFKALLIFLLMGIKHWAVGLWIFLFGISTYIFCFFKFQQTIFLLLPDPQNIDQWNEYYHHFLAVFYTQFGFMLFAIFFLIYDIGSTTDYFMIDWEKEKRIGNFDVGNQKKQASVWRKVLVVNELYELTISRLINIQFVMLFSLLFLAGLDWINVEYQVPNLEDLTESSTTKNQVLAYFIITFIIFIIAAGQYLLKYLFKVWMPLPHENFVDLCSISNISLIVFDESLHGYYIHGMNPLGQAEGSLNYIQSIFQKQAKCNIPFIEAFGKSRAFRNDDPDHIQVFEVVFPFQIRQSFQVKYKSRYLQKLIGKAYDTSVFAKPIPDMLDEDDYTEIEGIQNDMLESFKYYLEGVKTSQFNVKEKSFLQKIVNCPLDTEFIGRLPIFFKDYWNEFTNVLMSGHEFLFLMNTINMVNVWYIVTKSIFMAVFITMVISRLILKNLADISVKRNISKNTLIDDKFFN